MPKADLFRMQSDFKLVSDGDVSALVAAGMPPWKFIVPVPPTAGAHPGNPRDLVAFAPSKIAYFRNDGAGKFAEDTKWSAAANSPVVAKLDLGRNACAGSFTDGSKIDLFAQSDFSSGPGAQRKFSIWRITDDGLEKVPVSFASDFPWDDGAKDLQHLVAGDFFEDTGAQDDLLFYQGNKKGVRRSGSVQLLQLGFTLTPRFRDAWATWTAVLPCRGLSSTDPRTLLLFVDNGLVPWTELRRPTPRGHFPLVNLAPQPDAGKGPPIWAVGSKPLRNREVVALQCPFLDVTRDIMKILDPKLPPGPHNMDSWQNPGLGKIASRFFFGVFPSEGRFVHSFFSLSDSAYYYHVLDRNLQIVSDPDDPQKLNATFPNAVLADQLVAGHATSDLLVYSP